MHSNRYAGLIRFFAATGLALGVSACGYKGGLYMPAPPDASPPPITRAEQPPLSNGVPEPVTPQSGNTTPANAPPTLGPASTPVPPVTQIRGK